MLTRHVTDVKTKGICALIIIIIIQIITFFNFNVSEMRWHLKWFKSQKSSSWVMTNETIERWRDYRIMKIENNTILGHSFCIYELLQLLRILIEYIVSHFTFHISHCTFTIECVVDINILCIVSFFWNILKPLYTVHCYYVGLKPFYVQRYCICVCVCVCRWEWRESRLNFVYQYVEHTY